MSYLPGKVRAKNPSLTLNLETNGVKVTSVPPPTTEQEDCLQGQNRSAVTHPSSNHALRCLARLALPVSLGSSGKVQPSTLSEASFTNVFRGTKSITQDIVDHAACHYTAEDFDRKQAGRLAGNSWLKSERHCEIWIPPFTPMKNKEKETLGLEWSISYPNNGPADEELRPFTLLAIHEWEIT
ncbi:hypothetical protein J6590_105530 [Homalodisca vitripennis]|nr:hypothetical protein J6590_105530 [Homalodisca vitripennis]